MKNENWKNMKWVILVLVVILIPLTIFKSCQSSVKSQNEKKIKKIRFIFCMALGFQM